MNDDDLQKLSDEVLGTLVPDVEVERAWIEQQTVALRLQEQQMAAAFRLHKFMRKDGDMQRVAGDLKTTREMLAYMQKRLNELGS